MTMSTAVCGFPLQKIATARERYFSGDHESDDHEIPDIRPVVLAAWERSRAYGVNPYFLRPQKPDSAGLSAARSRNRWLLESAEPFLQLVHEELTDEPHLVAVSDADCVVLRILTGPGLPGARETSNLFEGASWHESDLGSNGVGTAVATGEPVILVGPEHFQEAYSGWTCIGVPIRQPDGSIAGAFDLSVPNEQAHDHAMGWARTLARGIEASLATAAPARHDKPTPGVADFRDSVDEVDALLDRLASQLDLAASDALLLAQARHAVGRLRTDLKQATDAVERTIEERDRMLALVNHDLRAPLSTIVMGAALLLEDIPDEKKSVQANRIRRATDQMSRLVDDLLDVSQLEVGRLSVALRPCRADELVRAAVDSCAPIAQTKSVAVHAEAETDQPVLADDQRILQVFTNLIGNAITHTPEGGRITVRARDAEGVVLFQVEDTGTGIKSEHLPHIFNRFWQASRSGRAGAGLGLAIVEGIVEAHGGEIDVVSEPGRGSTFSFTVPQAAGIGNNS